MARKSMNEVQESSGSNKITEAGEYHVLINKIEDKTTQEGTPFVLLTLEDVETQQVAWDRLFLTEKALGFTKRYLSACGYDMDDLDYEVETKGSKKGQVTMFYLTDADGDEEEYTLEELLDEEEVIITVKKQDDTYKDLATGETKTRTNPGVEITNVNQVPED
jgi:hypothetical protein